MLLLILDCVLCETKIHEDVLGFQSLKLCSQYFIEIYFKKLIEKDWVNFKDFQCQWYNEKRQAATTKYIFWIKTTIFFYFLKKNLQLSNPMVKKQAISATSGKNSPLYFKFNFLLLIRILISSQGAPKKSTYLWECTEMHFINPIFPSRILFHRLLNLLT